MNRLLVTIALRTAFAGVAAWVLWRLLGAVGLVVAAPLFGVLLARPLIEMAAELRTSARTLAWSDREGRHFEHRGWRIDIVEDDRHHRWVKLEDVRKVVPQLPRAAVLRRQFPDGLRDAGDGGEGRIHADALLAYLGRSTRDDAVRLRNWLERDVVRPAARLRQRLGIRDEVPTGAPPPAD